MARRLGRAPDPQRRPTSVAAAITRFALSGLAALTLVAIGSGVALRRLSTADAIRDARNVGRISARVAEANLTDAVIAGDPEAVEEFDQTVRDRLLLEPVLRIKIWTADGRIVYSDEPRLIGQNLPLTDDGMRALETGDASAALTDLAHAENRWERRFGKLLEVYQPIRGASGERLLFESYHRYSSVASEEHEIWLAFGGLFIAALVLLGVVQIPFAWSMVRRLHEGQREREALLIQAIQASDLERRRIASEVHDGMVQDLAGLSFSLAASADRLTADAPEDVVLALRRAASDARQSMRQLRALVLEIYPPNLRTTGLEAALSDLLAPLATRGIAAELDVPSTPRLGPEIEGLLFRTAQEGLRNVITHADARTVALRLSLADGRAVLVVEDDGRGFSPDDVENARGNGHVGLLLLSDLAASVGGSLKIDSAPGRGTRLRLDVPAP